MCTHTRTHTMCMCALIIAPPIADRVAQHLEIISKNFRFSTRRTRILKGFIIYYLVLIVNPMGRILVRWIFFRNNLEMLCHRICNWLYLHKHTCALYECAHIHTHTHVRVRVCMCVLVYSSSLLHKHIYVIYECAHTHAHTHACVCVYVCARILIIAPT